MSQHSQTVLIGCTDCGLVQRLPPLSAGSMAECVRCGHGLVRSGGGGADTSLAFTLAALLLLLPAVFSPLMSLICFGVRRQNLLPTGVQALWGHGFDSLAVVIFMFSIAIPLTYLGLMVWVLGALRFRAPPALGRLFRWAAQLRPWAMLEVYLVGCCVAYTRLQDIGTVRVNVGGWCLLGATLSALLAGMSLDEHAVWNRLPWRTAPAPERRSPSDNGTGGNPGVGGRALSCGACDLLLDTLDERGTCPRCGARVHRRKPDALPRTLALVLAGFVLYLPANMLPVLSVERFGHDEPNTILSGVRELISLGMWPLAAIVFTASILVPLMKLFGLSLMLALTRQHSRRWLIGRTRLYRFIDFIGRWSSIDLFMISILVALVQFGALTQVRPESGAVAFAAVVVVTMFASRCFDPRVMWDAAAITPRSATSMIAAGAAGSTS